MKKVEDKQLLYCYVIDVKNGIISHINDKEFIEDALRVLEISQIASYFGFEISPETKEIMKSIDLSDLPKERVYEEVKKVLMKSRKPSVFFEILREVNQLDFWFPELKATIGSEQNRKYHPEGDVWQHTMLTLDKMAELKDKAKNPEYLMFSALCHDLGKPIVLTFDNKGIPHNFGHEKSGVPVASEFIHRISDEEKLHSYVTNMVENHMKPHKNFDNKSRVKSTDKTFENSICPDDLLLLVYADSLSTGNTEYAENEYAFLKERLEIYKEKNA